MRRDHRDLCIETLADSEAALVARVRSLECDVRSYRDIAVAAIHALHRLTKDRDRLRERIRLVLDELRALRNQTRRAVGRSGAGHRAGVLGERVTHGAWTLRAG